MHAPRSLGKHTGSTARQILSPISALPILSCRPSAATHWLHSAHTLPIHTASASMCYNLPEDQHRMHNEHTSAFGAQLRRYREAAGLTQEQLAERAGLTVNAISLLERGLRQLPYLQTIRKLAAALGLSIVDIAAWR